MLNTLRQRMAKDEEGFTLIELMVVILIIAILMAIAIPTFLGAQERAQDRGAQSNLRNGLTAAKTIATDQSGSFLSSSGSALVAADLLVAEPSINFSGTTAATGTVGVLAGSGGIDIFLTNISSSGKHFGIKSTSKGEVTYCKGTAALTSGSCSDLKW